MGMFHSHIKLFSKMHAKMGFSGEVCSLGNQDIWATNADIESCIKSSDCSYSSPRKIIPHTSRTFSMNSTLQDLTKDFVHAKVMFESLGLSDYTDMDKYDSDHPDIIHDLNEPIPDVLKSRFGLVFDGGTVEHIFDVRQVLKNIVDLLELNGCVFHIASFSIDHGLFGLSPTLFFDFYGDNGFGDMDCYMLELGGADVTKTYYGKHRCVKYEYGMDCRSVLRPGKEVLVFFAARKLERLENLRTPTQGSYASRGNLSDTSVSTGQGTFERVLPSWLQPLMQPFRPSMRVLYGRLRAVRARRSAKSMYI